MHLEFKVSKKLNRKVNFPEVQRNLGILEGKNCYINNKIFHPNTHNHVHLLHYNQTINLTQNQNSNKSTIQVSKIS